MTRRISALAALFATVALAGPAAAEDSADDARWFENDVLHFEVGDNLLVTSTTVRAPEGPVEVVTVRPADRAMNGAAGPSFVSLTIFRNELPGEGTQTEIARDTIVDGARAAMHGAQIRVADRDIDLAGHDVDGTHLTISFEGANAVATAGAIAEDGVVVVYYDQRDTVDGPWFDALNLVAHTLDFGPAPEPEAPADDEGDDDHGDDDHGDDDHEDHGH